MKNVKGSSQSVRLMSNAWGHTSEQRTDAWENRFEQGPCLDEKPEKILTRDDVLQKLNIASTMRRSNVLRKAFSQLPEEWQQDRLVAFHVLDLDPTGRVLQIIPALDNESELLREDKEMVMKAVSKAGTNLKYVHSELLKNDPEIVLTAIRQSTRACKYIGDELRRDKHFIIDMLRELIASKRNQSSRPSAMDIQVEPQRLKIGKGSFVMPSSWPGNLNSDIEFGAGALKIPFGIDAREKTEEKQVEIITLDPYASQVQVVEAIDESLLDDPEVLVLIFELDCVALLFNDLRRKEMLASASKNPSSFRPMRPKFAHLVNEWHEHYERQPCEMKRLQCWPSAFWQPQEAPLAIADNIRYWIECSMRTKNPRLLAEAPKEILTDEDKMLEAVKTDPELFKVTPWKLRVSGTFRKKLEAAYPDSFLWITLEDARAEIPSKARDSEMGEMITAFSAVQKQTGLLQHQVPFLQLSM
jgi:hypothetical protein